MRALQQRQENLLKVAQAIAYLQPNFFEKGIRHLKPMTLRDVAEHAQIHESTVSRISHHKYISCTFGLFEIKSFFTSSINNAWTGEDQSATAIQQAIADLVNQEDPAKPLSDDQLVQALCTQDLSVARRTVSKYRDISNIPSSYERARRYKLGHLPGRP
jgi:RNA polymerase sigma-54 factor